MPSVVTFDPGTALNCTLDGSKLIVTRTTGSPAGVFVYSSEGNTSGKYYFEVTLTTVSGYINGGGWGIATTTATHNDVISGHSDTAMLFQQGLIYGGGSHVYDLPSSAFQGDVIGVAVDLDNRKIWFKDITQGGPWNGSVANGNPTTNLNGVVVPTGTIIPVIGFGSNPDIFTANFGGSVFVGAVPSGFVAWGGPAYVAFNVRAFGYVSLAQMHVSQQHRFSDDMIWASEDQPVWSQIMATNAATPVSIIFPGPGADTAKVLGIEVADGNQIRYELQLGSNASNARVPGNLSRRMSGFNYLVWAAGSIFRFVDAASFP